MGDTVEQWRAAVGQWSGGRPRQCVTSHHQIVHTADQIGYKYIRFLVLISLLVIGCVEMNPGPDNEDPSTSSQLEQLEVVDGNLAYADSTRAVHASPVPFRAVKGRLLREKTRKPCQSAARKKGSANQPICDKCKKPGHIKRDCKASGRARQQQSGRARQAHGVDGDETSLHPGINGQETSAPTRSAGALSTFNKRPGAVGLLGDLYGVKMAAFLFARALNRTEEFQLASNVDGAGAFDDLVFRYKLREPNVWKTCFIQLKHKESGGTIQRSSLTQMSGDFSLFKYFKSFCEIKNKAATDCDLKQCGPFDDFEFVIYTNASMEGDFTLQGGDSDPLYILSSGTNNGKYIAFHKTHDTEIWKFFYRLSRLRNLLGKRGTAAGKEINEEIKRLQNTICGTTDSLKSKEDTDNLTWIDELAKCDFTLFKKFLSKVKLFESQSNIEFLKGLTEKELQQACKASPSVANFIYTKFEEGVHNWWKRNGNVIWLEEKSDPWQVVQRSLITLINETSKPEIQEIHECGIRFNEQPLQKLSDKIKQSTVLNIVTKSSINILQKLKTYEALNILGYKNSLFIGITSSLIIRHMHINKLWPCKWTEALVVDCCSDDSVIHKVLCNLQQADDCEKNLRSDDNTAETFIDNLKCYQKKVIFISQRNMALALKKKFQNISEFEDNFDISDLDEESQNKILERTVNFQGTKVALSELVGTDPTDSIKKRLYSAVMSILLSNQHELCVGKKLGNHPKYYEPRVLQHQIYLKEDILKLTDNAITFAVSGLQANELKKHLPLGEKICEFVYDERSRSHIFKTLPDFSRSGLSAELENKKAYNEAGQDVKPQEVRYIILRNKNPDSEFSELKKLFTNLHWIHVQEGSLLWRDTNGNIDIIRRYIDNTKHQTYDMKSVVEHNDRTNILVADPGEEMSTFLDYMAHEIKKWKRSVWVLRIKLNKHTKVLKNTDFEQDCIDKCKEFLWSAAHSPKRDAFEVKKEIFLKALEQTGETVIILLGFDKISPDYKPKVEMLIKAIRDKTASKIWISSRFSYQQELEDIVGKFAFTLQPFKKKIRSNF